MVALPFRRRVGFFHTLTTGSCATALVMVTVARPLDAPSAGSPAYEAVSGYAPTASVAGRAKVAVPPVSWAVCGAPAPVNVTGPAISVGSTLTLGAGLQSSSSVTLGAGQHGGVTVHVASSDPSRVKVAATATSVGQDAIDVDVPKVVREGQLIRVRVSLSAPMADDTFAWARAVRVRGENLRGADLPRRWLSHHGDSEHPDRPLWRSYVTVGGQIREGRRSVTLEIPTLADGRKEGTEYLGLQLVTGDSGRQRYRVKVLDAD